MHKEHHKAKGKYLCNTFMIKGNPKKISELWEDVNCENCWKVKKFNNLKDYKKWFLIFM